jgi:hypothetical protein
MSRLQEIATLPLDVVDDAPPIWRKSKDAAKQLEEAQARTFKMAMLTLTKVRH